MIGAVNAEIDSLLKKVTKEIPLVSFLQTFQCHLAVVHVLYVTRVVQKVLS